MKVKKISKRIVNKLPNWIKNILSDGYIYIKYPEMREVKKNFGRENPDVTFYIIRPLTNTIEGLMSLLYNVLQQISYAEQKGYIPIVDFKNYRTQYNIENENAWEVFFLQPSQYTLDEVYKSKNVIISGNKAKRKAYKYLQHRSCDKENLRNTHSFFNKYIKCSNSVISILEREREILHPKNCIGLYLRGTDYTNLKPPGEPVQPSINEAIEKVEFYRKKLKINDIFLVTEDEKIYREIKKIYKNDLKIVSFDKFISKYNDNFLAEGEALDQISKNKHERGINYLIKILLLSECRCIIGGRTAGSWAACALADEDTEIEVFQLGVY